ncbi:sialate O-acetylesterase [Sphingobacterium chuzhouense]|uniref:Sialate O-acetylesterase n=1 Tax=Sphingobacterium chuzhouense TaxID=1742264 RepID=A0ABR7XUR0_9SPHI|nr:sialate O-acetylesterase [Sphingobacterium chuzhouense]MBD1422776.1 sialate O-acetylesterase [Sphingobacterium chuzhouense]
MENKQKVYIGIGCAFLLWWISSCASHGSTRRTGKQLDLYLLVGQSNMAGRGFLDYEDTLAHPNIYVLNASDEWSVAKEPLHYDKANRGVGPGLAFAKNMAKYQRNASIGLIPAAVGGTKISYWEPTGERGLYKEALRKARVAKERGTLKGLLWQQGESDANTNDALLYKERLIALMHAFRRDLESPNLPIVIGGLGDFLKSNRAEQINQAMKEAVDILGNAAYSEASKLGHIGDSLHFNSAAQRENGMRMAEAMKPLLNKKKL